MKSVTLKQVTLACWASIMLAAPLLATQASAMTANQTVLKEIKTVDATGQVQIDYVTADLVTPGEAVIYRVDYINDGTDPVTDFELTMPVPAEIRFSGVIDQGTSQRIVYSANNAQSFHALSGIVTTGNQGEMIPAVPEDITHIRWTIEGDMPAGTSGHVAFRGVLE